MKKTRVLAAPMVLAVLLLPGCGAGNTDSVKTVKIGVTLYDQYDTFITQMMNAFTQDAAEQEASSGIAINVEIVDAAEARRRRMSR